MLNGLGMTLGNLSRLSNAQTRSVSAKNVIGEKGKGGMATKVTGQSCARDICSTAFWYQTLPATPFPELPDRDALEIV